MCKVAATLNFFLRDHRTFFWKATVLFAAVTLLAVNFQPASAVMVATIVVNSAADPPLAIDGTCTLRKAILAANANTGVDCVGGSTSLDTISFDPTVFTGDLVISVSSDLPPITGPVVIQGSSSHWIKVRGPGGSSTGFTFAAGSAGSVLDHMMVDGWHTGVELDGGGVSLTNNRIGVDFSGTASDANTNGIVLNSSKNVVGGLDSSGHAQGNLISGNSSYGIVASSGSNNLIQGNYIGTDDSGNSALGNGTAGIGLNALASNTVIGGSLPHQGNVISGNTNYQVVVYSGAKSTKIMRNVIGLGADGMSGISGTYGIYDRGGSGTMIGGTMPQSSNFIANQTYGIYLRNDSNPGTVTISGNIIGNDTTGGAASQRGRDLLRSHPAEDHHQRQSDRLEC